MTPTPSARLAPTQRPPEWLTADLERIEELLVRTAGASEQPIVSEPSLHLLRAGGKRVRPALVLLSAHAGEPGRRSTDLAAAAIELVHLATLYHDDVIDGTQTRRGVPTTHVKWGTEVAVLAGDFLFACGCSLGADAGGEVPGILARAIAEVCEGEIIETAQIDDPHRTVDSYVDTIRHKTAALFRAACELGASTSGASSEQRASLARYGEHLGLAFQIIDDLLDLIGDPEVTGKPLGTDLAEGVYTIPVLLACARDPVLVEHLSRGQRDVEVVVPIIEATGALDDAHDQAMMHARRAVEALAPVGEGPWRDALETMALQVVAQVAAA